MTDSALVTRKLTRILADLKRLAPLATGPVDAFVGNDRDQALVERYLERIIGRMIDVNYHLIASAGEPPPSDYFGSFGQLVRLGILTPDFATRIAASAGLRNRLVHEYDDLDAARVHAAANVAIHDVPDYVRAVQDYVARTAGA